MARIWKLRYSIQKLDFWLLFLATVGQAFPYQNHWLQLRSRCHFYVEHDIQCAPVHCSVAPTHLVWLANVPAWPLWAFPILAETSHLVLCIYDNQDLYVCWMKDSNEWISALLNRNMQRKAEVPFLQGHLRISRTRTFDWASQVVPSGKDVQCRRHKRCGFNPWVGKFPAGGNGNPLQYSCLENPVDKGAWRPTVHGSQRVRHSWSGLAYTHAYLWLINYFPL